MSEFFKDARHFVRDMPQIIRWLLVALFVIGFMLLLRYTVKMFYNKAKIKFTIFPIIVMIILVALTVFLCIA